MTPVISQSDIVTAYGWGIDPLFAGLMSRKTAIKSTTRFTERGFVSDMAAVIPDLVPNSGESRVMAMLRRLLAPLIGKLDPRTPLILATTVGEIEIIENAVLEDRPKSVESASPDNLAARIADMLGLHGPVIALSSACASSTAAVTRAASMVRHEVASAVLVVCCDAVSEFVYSGFSSLLSLSAEPARPFDRDRCGLSLGEAAAWALVSRDGPGISILGWGNTTDAIHMTAPDRNAGGLSRAIAKALAMSKISPESISVIAAHGTGTLYSDAMEMVAFQRQLKSPRPVFSMKGGIGHTLAAAGLAQILVAGRALTTGQAPPNLGSNQTDDTAENWVRNSPVDLAPTGIALSTNSGFGGVNTVILLGRGATT